MKRIESVSAGEFLDLEARARARLQPPPGVGPTRKFRAVVRSFVKTWLDRAPHRLVATRDQHSLSLHFELRDGERWVACFSLNIHLADGLYTLKGPNEHRQRIPMSAALRSALDELNDEWQNRPESEGLGRLSTTVYLQSWSAAQVAKYAAAARKTLGKLHPVGNRPVPVKDAAPASPRRKAAGQGTSRKSTREKTARSASRRG